MTNMDDIGVVVSRKIREAIRRKLQKISTFFEEELPEYIMVMVANKRSRAQMENDLCVFLGDETTSFMDWMEKTLATFQSSPLSETDDANEGKIEKVISFPVEPDGDVSMGDFLAIEINEDVDDLDCELKEEINKSSVSAFVATHSPLSVLAQKPSTGSVMINKQSENLLFERSNPIQQKVKSVPCSAVFPVKRGKNPAAEIDLEDSKQCFGSVASVIRVSERKFSVPPSRQANKLLLLRAMEAANKSVQAANKSVTSSSAVVLNDPRKIDTSPKHMNSHTSEVFHSVCKEPMDTEEKNVSNSSAVNNQTSNGNSNSVYMCEEPPEKLKVDSAFIRTIDITSKQENSDFVFNHNQDESLRNCHEIPAQCATRFVVTLDGMKPSNFNRKRTLSDLSDEDMDENLYSRAVKGKDFVHFKDEQTTSATHKRQKFNEKCRFWPACKNGSECNFHHPTTSCRVFPNCKYGDRCLYIHPNCKFDALCSRKDCPYTHASKRKFPPKVLEPKRSSKLNGVCKYFPNCQFKKCLYKHPKLCRNGIQCTMAGCSFGHAIPTRAQLKWQA